MADNGSYYASGTRVYRSPMARKNASGTTSSTMGFLVCECAEHVKGAAEHVAAALNATNSDRINMRSPTGDYLGVIIHYTTEAEAAAALALVTP